jgi:hypothetical protein
MLRMSQPKPSVFVPALFSVVGVLLGVLAVAHFITNIPFAKFTADPAATFGYNPLYGYISNIGILLWCSCVSVCFLSAGLLRVYKEEGQMFRFLICFGILTAVLMLDDLFMFHESLGPSYLNISEKWVLLSYGMYTAFCLYHFRRTIMLNDVRYLILAVAAFGVSVLVDQISSRFYFPGEYFVEDGLKLTGIASWLAYFVTLSFSKMTSVMAVKQAYRTMKWKENRHSHFVYSVN